MTILSKYPVQEMCSIFVNRAYMAILTFGKGCLVSFLLTSVCNGLPTECYWDNDYYNSRWGNAYAANWEDDLNPPDHATVHFDDRYVSGGQIISVEDGDKTLANLFFSGPHSYRLNQQTCKQDLIFDTNGEGSSFLGVWESASGNTVHFLNIDVFLQNALKVFNLTDQLLTFEREIRTCGQPLTFDGTGSIWVKGRIRDGGSVIKEGTGLLRVSADNSFCGGLIVNKGTVFYDEAAHLDVAYSSDGRSAFGKGDVIINEAGVLSAKTSSGKDIRVGGNFTVNKGGLADFEAADDVILRSCSTVTMSGGLFQSRAADCTAVYGRIHMDGESIFDVQEGDVYLSCCARIDGGEGPSKGLLRLTENLVVADPTLSNRPDITIVADTNSSIKGLCKTGYLTGVGTLIKKGVATTTIESSINNLEAITIEIQTGTLLLGASHRIADTSDMILSGGVLGTGRHDEHLGTLTLSGDSIIDMGCGGGSVLVFAGSSGETWEEGHILRITNWTGSLTGGGCDQLFFGSSSGGLQTGQVDQIWFVDPARLAPGTYSAHILGTGEIVPFCSIDPVPEPSTWVGGLALLGLFGWKKFRRLCGLIRTYV